jgi:hypothetical protein
MVGKTVKTVVQSMDKLLIQFTDGELIALGAGALNYDGSSVAAMLNTTDAEVDDFDTDDLLNSGILTLDDIADYLRTQAQIEAFRDEEHRQYRHQTYLKLKAEFEPDTTQT